EHVPRSGRLDDSHVGALDQLVERRGRFGVPGIGDDLAVDMDPVTGAAHRAVIQLHRLVLHPCYGPGRAGRDVLHLELRPHHAIPVRPPADLPELLEVLLDAGRPDKGDWPPVHKDAMQDERRQAQRVVAVEVREKNGLDAAWIDPEPVHVGQQRRAAVQQHAAVDNHSPVVAVQRERRAAAEERELYAMVTAGLRYTSWIACSNSMPSFMGRWNDLRPLIRPIPPARLLITAVRTASFRSVAPLLSPPELMRPARPM